MRLGGEPESSHFEDRTGQGGGLGFGGGGGSALGCLIPLVMSRFGLGGVLILIVGYFVLSSLGAFSGGGGGILPGSGTQRSASCTWCKAGSVTACFVGYFGNSRMIRSRISALSTLIDRAPQQ